MERPEAQVIIGQGDGQGVGGIGWFRPADKPQFPLHGHLHLLLAGMTIAGKRALHAIGQVVVHGEARLGGGQTDHAPGMPHQDGGLGEASVDEDLLDRHRPWPEGLEHLTHASVNLNQPRLEQVAARADRARLEQPFAGP